MTMFFLLLLPAATAYAQSDRPEDRVQVRGVLGWAGFLDESWLHHGSAGTAVDLRLAAGLRVGPELLYEIGPGKDRDITLTGIVGYDFRRLKRLSPFISGGAGWLSHRDRSLGWRGSPTFGVGGGLKVAVSKRYFLAPEVRVGWEPFLRVMVSVGRR